MAAHPGLRPRSGPAVPDADLALKVLARRPWVPDPDPGLPAALVAAGRLVRVPAGRWIQAEGDAETGLAFVIEGAVQLYIRAPGDREVLLAHVEDGSVFGQTTRFGGGPRIVTAICVVPSLLLIVSDTALGRLAAGRADIWRVVAALAYAQLRGLSQAMAVLLGLPPRPRLAARLLDLAAPKDRGAPLTLHIGQQALGELVGLTRKTVNGLLAAFEREGLVRLGYGQVELLDPAGLDRVANS